MTKAKIVLGAIVGATAGFITGILTAPKSGKETRADIKEKATEYKDVAGKKADQVKTKAESVANDVKVKTGEVVEDVKEKAQDLKGRTERAVAGAKKGFNSKK